MPPLPGQHAFDDAIFEEYSTRSRFSVCFLVFGLWLRFMNMILFATYKSFVIYSRLTGLDSYPLNQPTFLPEAEKQRLAARLDTALIGRIEDTAEN